MSLPKLRILNGEVSQACSDYYVRRNYGRFPKTGGMGLIGPFKFASLCTCTIRCEQDVGQAFEPPRPGEQPFIYLRGTRTKTEGGGNE